VRVRTCERNTADSTHPRLSGRKRALDPNATSEQVFEKHSNLPHRQPVKAATSRPLTTLVDSALAAHDVVWAAAGHPHAVFPTTFAELIRISAGRAATVA